MGAKQHPSGWPLEPDGAELQAMTAAVAQRLAVFVDTLDDHPASDTTAAADAIAALPPTPPEQPGRLDELLDLTLRAAEPAFESAGPGYLAYIPGGGLVTAAIAELLAAGLNRYTGVTAAAPALVAMESSVLRWLCDLFSLPEGAQGILTTGGSLANLSAIATARTERLGERFDDGVLYVSAHTHHSVAKAARLAGFPTAAVRTVACRADLRLDTDALRAAIADDRRAGRRPYCVVANAGSTDTGTVDDLGAIAAVAAEEGLWLHVDAAYGGFFQLTERGRARLAGIEHADSITLDPHKGLFLPYGTGCLLVRDGQALRRAHQGDAAYLQDLVEVDDLPDFSSYSPELTRDFRGLRLWLPLHLHGVAAFRDALDEKLDLAQDAWAALRADPLLDVPWEPDLTVVGFRLAGRSHEASRRVLARINTTQRLLLTSTWVGGRYFIRLAILAHRTHRHHVDEAVRIIRTAARESSSRI